MASRGRGAAQRGARFERAVVGWLRVGRHELAPPHPRCHVCGARVYVGETAHDVEPGDDGVERFACAEHCEVCR